MRQDLGCRPDDPISPIPGYECVLLCPSLCGVFIIVENKTPQLKNPGRALQPHQTFTFYLHGSQHYRIVTSEHAHQTGVKAVKNFLHSLGTDFYQDNFLKLISLYDKCVNIDGKHVKK
ncbi:hypothetical protein AVEN_226716-1 [Araneus ventricosus]|uniref:Uncharacterized protein n=1 Tax=Araneus ventricosus TaxID=182803 RepID=A0A4Y2CXQ2_ARAVE|nr:hypothetical protein AVEN_226716-1 [Araneus ventricosus]